MRTIVEDFTPNKASHGKNGRFSKDSQGNPTNTIAGKCKRVFVSHSFPPMHRTHHNNKAQF